MMPMDVDLQAPKSSDNGIKQGYGTSRDQYWDAGRAKRQLSTLLADTVARTAVRCGLLILTW